MGLLYRQYNSSFPFYNLHYIFLQRNKKFQMKKALIHLGKVLLLLLAGVIVTALAIFFFLVVMGNSFIQKLVN